jgi:uncharacterized protein involved in exopolysaccharide biosynthesis
LGEIRDALRRAGLDVGAVEPDRVAARGAVEPPPSRGGQRPPALAPAAEARAPARAGRRGSELDADAFVSLREIAAAIRRRWRLALAVFALTLGAVTVVTFLQTPIYESTATLLVKLGREFFYRSEVGEREVFANRDRESVLNSELQILRSQDVVDGVIRSIGVATLYPDLAAAPPEDTPLERTAALRFQGDYSIVAVPDTEVIQVSFRHSDPELAARTVSSLVEHLKEKHLATFSEREAASFLEAKVAASREQLAKSEEQLKSFEAEHEAFSLRDPGEYILGQREEIEASLRDVHQQIASLEQRRAQEPPAIAQARARLLELEVQEQTLLSRFKESSRTVVNLRKEIDQVRRFLEEQQAELARRQLAELRPLEQRQAELEARMGGIEAELRELPVLATQHRELRRQRDTSEKHLQTYSRNLEEARLSQEMDRQKIANISVIQEGLVPSEPISPRKRLNLAVGIVSGLALGLLAAYYADGIAPRARRDAPA